MTHKMLSAGQPATIEAPSRLSTPTGFTIRDAVLLFGLLLLTIGVQLPRAASAHGYNGASPQFSAAACQQLVQDAGRPIAWARWEKGLSLEKTRSAKLRDSMPGWVGQLVQEWIADAYQWRANDEQIRQCAAQLGSVEDLPSAARLSVHETIGIWVRRIARQCDRDMLVKAANRIREEVGLEQ